MQGSIESYPLGDNKSLIKFIATYKLLFVSDFDFITFNRTVRKVSVFEVFLVRTFPHSYWIWRDTPYLSVFSTNAGKYAPEKLRIRTHFTLCHGQGHWNNIKKSSKIGQDEKTLASIFICGKKSGNLQNSSKKMLFVVNILYHFTCGEPK